MAPSKPLQKIFGSDQYFWCSEEENTVIKTWLVNQHHKYPHIYATYINDANMVIRRKHNGQVAEHDGRMRAFLEQYPMTYTKVIEEFVWYTANVLETSSTVTGPHMTGLINVESHGNDPEALSMARDQLYKHVFDVETRHKHWEKRRELGTLNSNDVEPLTKQQKSMQRSQRRWDEQYQQREVRPSDDATIDPAFWADEYGENSAEYAGRLMLDLEVKKGGGNQHDAGEDEEMEG
ncbi:hypothetical protein D6C92_08521 [Aureobasidium pullulans]|nr:hypothetical protein D6C92_08521 [Aureobasidium pullulans]